MFGKRNFSNLNKLTIKKNLFTFYLMIYKNKYLFNQRMQIFKC